MSYSFLRRTLRYKSLAASRVSNDLNQAVAPKKNRLHLHQLLFELIVIISDLTAGVLNIQRVVSFQYKHSFDQFRQFLQTLEVYGCGYDDDIDE